MLGTHDPASRGRPSPTLTIMVVSSGRSFRGSWGLGLWLVVIALGLGSVAGGFAAGTWWQNRETGPQRSLWVLAHSADAAQLTPASDGLFTLSLSPSDPQVLAVRKDSGGGSELIPLLRLESEWQDMFGDESVDLTLLIHDAPTDADPESSSPKRIELRSAAPVVDGNLVTYPVEVIKPAIIADDAVLRAFTKVTLMLPEAERTQE